MRQAKIINVARQWAKRPDSLTKLYLVVLLKENKISDEGGDACRSARVKETRRRNNAPGWGTFTLKQRESGPEEAQTA